MKKVIALILAFVMISGLVACGNADRPANENPPKTSETVQPSDTEELGTVIYTDSLGREVEVPANITRIVPSAPLPSYRAMP